MENVDNKEKNDLLDNPIVKKDVKITNMQKFLIVFTLVSIVGMFVGMFVFFWLMFFFVSNGSIANVFLLIMIPVLMPLVGIFI
jgi:hypothetical protein